MLNSASIDPKSFMLQIAGTPDIDAIARSPYDLVVLEAGTNPLSDVDLKGGGALTTGALTGPSAEDLDLLQSEGRILLGYVNVAVTDSNRIWWDSSWTTGGTAGELDQGVPTGDAPSWLANSRMMASDANQTFGPIVDFTQPAILPVIDGEIDTSNWWDIVAEQAVATVRAGYDGVFLDDVLRYAFDYFGDNSLTMTESELRSSADEMIAMLDFVIDAVHAENADAVVVLNGGAYLGDNDTATSLFAELAAQVDGVLLEGATAQRNAFDRISALFGEDTWLLGIDTDTNYSNDPTFFDHALLNEILTMRQPTGGYDDIPDLTPGTIGPLDNSGDDTIDGTDSAEILRGGGGIDTIKGLGGDDFIFGGDGSDVIEGGDGNDIIYGGEGDDIIFGGPGNDIIIGGGGDDIIDGGGGNDLIFLGEADQDIIDWWLTIYG